MTAIRLGWIKWLPLEPGKRGKLIAQLVPGKQADEGLITRRGAPLLLGRTDLRTDKRSGVRAQSLPAAIWCKKYPAVLNEVWCDRLEGGIVDQSWCATVVVQHRRERASAAGLIEQAMQYLVAGRESHCLWCRTSLNFGAGQHDDPNCQTEPISHGRLRAILRLAPRSCRRGKLPRSWWAIPMVGDA